MGYVVSVCPIPITNATPIKVTTGPTPKISHFDFIRIRMFLMLISDINRFIVLNPFIDSFL
jgi:hypothetical protein